MKRGSRVLLFLVIVIVILIAIAFFVLRGNFFSGGAGVTQTPSPMVNIVVVGQPINRDDEINQDALTTMPFNQASVTSKMVTDPQQIIGKFALYPLAQGLPLTTDMIAERPGLNQPGSDAAKVVSPGLVAIAIPVSRLSSVAYGIRDGDRVNVIATTMFVDVDASFQSKLPNYTAKVTGPGFLPDTLPVLSASVLSGGPGSEQGRAELDPTVNQALYLVPSESQRPRLVSQMILQDIQVLHLGDFALAQSEATSAPADAGQPAPTASAPVVPQLDLITLIVTPQDAVALTYLMYGGAKFTMALRAPDDTSRVETEAATLQYLLSQYAIPVPAKLPYAMDNKSLPLNQNILEPFATPLAP
jgi:Flp pilus assembly protein CpaB